ncbi:hypothetical protein GCM10009830_03010 [Glycomyces endophyticus]|uniref:Uncharacterized protein n=1 Tax=Glycomyces endophyticus TaxID=480996 RepID=A0ABN2FWW8_9ACTN
MTDKAINVPVRTVVVTPARPIRAAWMLCTPIANAASPIAGSVLPASPASASSATSATSRPGTPKLVSTCLRVASDAATAPSENPASDHKGPTAERPSSRPVSSPDRDTARSTAFPVWLATNCCPRARNPAPSTAPASAVRTRAVHACA